MAIVLALAGRPPLEIDDDSITIGRESSSTVAFPGDEKISSHHAVIRKVAGRWLVEAREASFLQVGNAAPARVNWLSPGDVIRLAEGGPEIVFQPPAVAPTQPAPIALPVPTAPPAAPPIAKPVTIEKPVPVARPVAPAPAAPQPPVDAELPFLIDVVDLQSLRKPAIAGNGPLIKPVPRAGSEPRAATRKRPQPRSPALLIVSILGTSGVLAMAAWVFFGRGAGRGGDSAGADGRKPAETQPQTLDTASSAGPSSNKKASTADGRAAPPIVGASTEAHTPIAADKPVVADKPATAEVPAANPPASNVAPQPSDRPQQSSPVDVHSRLSAVFVNDSKGKRQFRLGTAWTVSPRKLVTSGAVVLAIEDLQRAGLSASVVSQATSKELRVTALRAHPVYRQAAADALAARQELKKLNAAAEPAAPKTKQADDAMSERIQAVREQLANAYDSQANFDMGILEVDQNLPGPLTLAASALPQRADTPFVMAGLPYPSDDYHFAVFAQPVRPVQCAGRSVAPADPASAGTRLTLEFLDEFDRQNWSGSPVLNEAGQVVGVYSRPAGRPEGNSAQLQPHAVTWIGRLKEFVLDLK